MAHAQTALSISRAGFEVPENVLSVSLVSQALAELYVIILESLLIIE